MNTPTAEGPFGPSVMLERNLTMVDRSTEGASGDSTACMFRNAWGRGCGHAMRWHRAAHPLAGETECVLCCNLHGSPTNQDAGDAIHPFTEAA